jgi:hypothetical protein
LKNPPIIKAIPHKRGLKDNPSVRVAIIMVKKEIAAKRN